MNFKNAVRKTILDVVGKTGVCLDGEHCPEAWEAGGALPDFAVPVNIGNANAAGVLDTIVRSDHIHNHPAGLGFALHHDHYARYIWNILGLPADSTSTMSTDEAYLLPMQVEFTVTVDRGILLRTGTAAGNARFGIYADNGDTPAGGALLVESASVAAAGTWRKDELTLANTTLTPDLYWLVMQPDNDSDSFQTTVGGQTDAGGTLLAYYYGHAYGGFTDPCPAVTATTKLPQMGVRVTSVP